MNEPRKGTIHWSSALAILAAILFVLYGIGASVDPVAQSAPNVSAAATQSSDPYIAFADLTIKGKGEGNSRQFYLAPGNYGVVWGVYSDCLIYAHLRPGTLTADELFSAETFDSGTNYLYDVAGGDYYIKTITAPGCKWEATFLRQP